MQRRHKDHRNRQARGAGLSSRHLRPRQKDHSESEASLGNSVKSLSQKEDKHMNSVYIILEKVKQFLIYRGGKVELFHV